jgi:hypothetical protein
MTVTVFDIKKIPNINFFSSDFAKINLVLDPDPDSAKYLDPVSKSTDPKHWFIC